MERYPGRLAIQQRILTPYRAAFFDALADACGGGLSVFAGPPLRGESAAVCDSLRVAGYRPARNLHLFRGPLLLCYQRGLLDWLSDWNPDALIAEVNPRTLSTPAGVRWMKQRGRPALGWGLGMPASEGPGSGLRRALFCSAVQRFDALITYSQLGARQYAGLGFPEDRITVAPNAATPAPSRPLPSRPERYAGRPSLLFVGRLQSRKRIDVLLHACAALPPALQPRLVIVGDGPERPGLEALAARVHPLTEFAGARHGAELAPFFQAADLFVLPGTGGLAVQEAMSWGLPVVMGRGDGTNDELVRPANGWQVPDPEALPALLAEALSDVSRLRRMGAESYRIVSQEINLERLVGHFVRALKGVSGGTTGL